MTHVAAHDSRRRGDSGAVALEYAGTVPLAFFVIFLAFQAYVSFTTVSRVENIARTGAREAASGTSRACASSTPTASGRPG